MTALVPRNGVRWTLRCDCRCVSVVPSAAVVAPIRCIACGVVFTSPALALAVRSTMPPGWDLYCGADGRYPVLGADPSV